MMDENTRIVLIELLRTVKAMRREIFGISSAAIATSVREDILSIVRLIVEYSQV